MNWRLTSAIISLPAIPPGAPCDCIRMKAGMAIAAATPMYATPDDTLTPTFERDSTITASGSVRLLVSDPPSRSARVSSSGSRARSTIGSPFSSRAMSRTRWRSGSTNPYPITTTRPKST